MKHQKRIIVHGFNVEIINLLRAQFQVFWIADDPLADIQYIKIKEKLHKNKHKKPLFGLINKYLIYPNCSKYIIKKFISEEKRFLIKNYLLQLNSIDAKKYQYDEIKKTIFRKYYKKTIDDVKYIVDRELNAWKY